MFLDGFCMYLAEVAAPDSPAVLLFVDSNKKLSCPLKLSTAICCPFRGDRMSIGKQILAANGKLSAGISLRKEQEEFQGGSTCVIISLMPSDSSVLQVH